MATEDLTTYTITGANSTDITATADRATLGLHSISRESWIYKDKGIDHFVNWSHDIDVKPTVGMELASNWWFYIISNANLVAGTQYSNDDDGIGIMLNRSSGGTNTIYICSFPDNSEIANTTGYTLGTTLYFTVTRASDLAVIDIYSDGDRTNLTESVYLTCPKNKFRYFIPISSYGIGGSGALAGGFVENIELNETGCNTFLLSGDTSTLEFSMPETLSILNNRGTQEFNFFSGINNVFDVGKETESITMVGYHNSGVSIFFEALEEIVDNGEIVTISEFNIPDIDTTWVISDYSYTVTGGTKDKAQYNITLEKT